jgi:hypothetical protein
MTVTWIVPWSAASPEEQAMNLRDDIRDLIRKLELCAQMSVGARIDPRSIRLLLEVLEPRTSGFDALADPELFRIQARDGDQKVRDLGVSCDAEIALTMFEAAAKEETGNILLMHGARVLKERPNILE